MTSKVMVSFPDDFLNDVDRIAAAEHRTRSELLREAMRLYMATHGRPESRYTARTDRLADPAAVTGLGQRDQQIVRELRQRLSSVALLIDLRVFGSRARGDAAPDSDLDVFIEVETITPEMRQQITDIAWEVGFANDRVISTIVVTREQLERGPMCASPLLAHIEREGIRP